MIQQDGLNDALKADGLPQPIRRAFVPPSFEATIDCDGARHAIAVVDGIPFRTTHESDEERALNVLGADAPSCAIARDAIRNRLSNVPASAPARSTDYPKPLDRLVELALMRAAVVRSHWMSSNEETSRLTRERARRTGVTKDLLRDCRLELKDGPALRPASARRSKTYVGLARDWLSTVWLFGLEVHDGSFVTSMRAQGDEVVLTILATEPTYRLEEVRTRVDGVRFL